MASELKLQALKENVESVEVNAVKVAPGDMIAKDQPLLEVQADKAALDVASPVAGGVRKILVGAGDQVKVGQPYALVEETDGAPEAKEAPPARAEKPAAQPAEPPKQPSPKPPAAAPEAIDGNGQRAHAP